MSSIGWILAHISKVKWILLIGTFCLLMETTMHIATIQFQKNIIDYVFYEKMFDLLPILILQFGLAGLLHAASFVLAGYFLNKSIIKFEINVMESLMKHIHKMKMGNFLSERISNYVNNFTSDINRLSHFLNYNLPKGLQLLLNILIMGPIIFVSDPFILLMTLAFAIIYFFLGKWFIPRVKKISREVQDHRAEYLVHIEEGISSTREVIAFNRMVWEQNKLSKYFQKYFTSVIKEGIVQNKKFVITEPLKWGVSLVVFVIGGYKVLTGQVSVGTLVILYRLSNDLLYSVHGVFDLVVSFSENVAYIDRIKDVLNKEVESDGTTALKDKVTSVSFRSVWFHYDEAPENVLKGINIDFYVGRKNAIVGESGSGKSTIAHLLLRFYQPTNGQIIVNGVPLSDITYNDWANKVRIVFQEPYLFEGSIKKNLLLGREDIDDDQMIEICKAACIHEDIMNLPLQYETVIGERGVTLSGGQKQRLAIARALLEDPEILILDESTSAIDMETEREIQANIDKLRSGKTTVIIAHRLSTIINADRIFVIEKGRCVASGRHDDLLAEQSSYYSLFLAHSI